MSTTGRTQRHSDLKTKRGNAVPVLCRVLGTLLIVMVFALMLPLSIPRIMGYEVYSVVNGSMEPTVPAGSITYVRSVSPTDVQVDEIVAFMDEASVVARRVVENRIASAELVTEGSADNRGEMVPIRYDELIGVVALYVPFAGRVMGLYVSNVGKIYLMLALACGVMLNILGGRIRRERSQRLREEVERQLASDATVDEATLEAMEAEELRTLRSGGWVRTVIVAVLAITFVESGAVVAFVNWQYHLNDEVYDDAKRSYVVDSSVAEAGAGTPIQIDFGELLRVNPDVQGWIYCEGTDINYPVMRGETNDTYLRHDYRGVYNVRGSIFVDADNNPGFTDANTIVYGHHMSSGTMFAALEEWENQAYYEAHPCMWLLTPEQDYQVVLVSASHANANSELYEIHHEHDEGFSRFLAEATRGSDFVPASGVDVDPNSNYVMLTTCSYVSEDARYIVFGKLVPINGASDVALPVSARVALQRLASFGV